MTMKLRRGVAGHVGEGNDFYPDVVVVLDDKTRVIVCQDGIQWIVQTRQPQQPRQHVDRNVLLPDQGSPVALFWPPRPPGFAGSAGAHHRMQK
jgi:hypothetical protein